MEAITDILQQAEVSQYLATNQIANGNIFSGVLDNNLDKILYTERKSVAWAYSQNNNDPSLVKTGNYLFWLMGKFRLQAIGIIAGGGGGTPISPITPPISSGTYLIPILAAAFADATNYNNPLIVGKNLQIFYNNINRFLLSGEYSSTSTGVQILLDGFDAKGVNSDAEMNIFIVN